MVFFFCSRSRLHRRRRLPNRRSCRGQRHRCDSDSRGPSLGARRPWSVAATAGERMGDARGAEGHRIQERRRAATSPGRRRAACTRVAQLRRAILPAARVGWHDAHRIARCRPPIPAPAARGPSPRPPARGWGCAAGGSAASRGARGGRRMAHHLPSARDPMTSASGPVTGTPTRSLRARGAGAPGDHFRTAAVGR
jgi:hypothetical protein